MASSLASPKEGKLLTWRLLLPLFLLVTLINLVFTSTRCLRSALAVADQGGSALSLPFYELLGTMPLACLVAWGLSRLLRRHTFSKVFGIATLAFVTFFLAFAFAIYPSWRLALFGLPGPLKQLPILAFFAVAELWKVVLLTVLLFGLLNSSVQLRSAQFYYAPLMLGTSFGALLVGPMDSLAHWLLAPWLAPFLLDSWHCSIGEQLLFCSGLALVSWALFAGLARSLSGDLVIESTPSEAPPFLGQALAHTWSHPLLRSIGAIVISDYVVYSLFEVVFLDLAKQTYPSPDDYRQLMGLLSQGGGVLTALFALVIGPWLLTRSSWQIAALVTPLGVFLLAFSFFAAITAHEQQLALYIGCLLYAFGRAAKYGLLDPAKELAFIPLDRHSQQAGKMAIDGIASRFGRASASFFLLFFGATPAATAPLLLFFTGVWLYHTLHAAGAVQEELLPASAHPTA